MHRKGEGERIETGFSHIGLFFFCRHHRHLVIIVVVAGSEAAQSLATLLVHSKALTSLNIAGCCLGRPPTLSSFKSAILEKSVNFEADDILSASLAKKRCLSIDVSCNDLTESRMVELFR